MSDYRSNAALSWHMRNKAPGSNPSSAVAVQQEDQRGRSANSIQSQISKTRIPEKHDFELLVTSRAALALLAHFIVTVSSVMVGFKCGNSNFSVTESLYSINSNF